MTNATAFVKSVAGIDGCRTGWVIVTLQYQATQDAVVRVITDLHEVMDQVDAGVLGAVAIDMPIGLAENGPRRADIEARKLLGARRSFVFPAPARSVLTASTYQEACALSRTACGKAVSKQLFNILPKIREIDLVITPRRQRHVFEMSPELSLAVLTGAPMTRSKATQTGRDERVRALSSVYGHEQIMRHVRRPPTGARIDDVLDAFAGVWTAQRYMAVAHQQLGGDRDARGLRMEVVA